MVNANKTLPNVLCTFSAISAFTISTFFQPTDLVASLEVPEDGAVIEEGQVGHVLALLKLGRVDLAEVLGLEHLLLVAHHHRRLLPVVVVQQTLVEAAGAVRTPEGRGNMLHRML